MITNPVGIATLSKREITRFLSVAAQSVFPPLVTSFLFMFIFGVAIGSRINITDTGLSYLEFIVPGLMTLHLISSSYENTSFSLFIARWHNHIQEILLSPLSFIEMVLGLLAGGLARGTIICFGVYGISHFFEHISIAHPFMLIYFILTISIIFSCAGMIVALWAEDFGMLSVWNIYLIVPMVFLGGVFHPISILPEVIQQLSKFNPMFYLVQGVRYSITGIADTSILTAGIISISMACFFFTLTVFLFKIGYKLRP